MHSNSPEVNAATAAALLATKAGDAHLPKTSPTSGGASNNAATGIADATASNANAAVGGGGGGEQPLDLSAKPSGCSGSSGLYIDPKQAFR